MHDLSALTKKCQKKRLMINCLVDFDESPKFNIKEKLECRRKRLIFLYFPFSRFVQFGLL